MSEDNEMQSERPAHILIAVPRTVTGDVERALHQALALRGNGCTVTLVIPQFARPFVSRALDHGISVMPFAARNPEEFDNGPVSQARETASYLGCLLRACLGPSAPDVAQFAGTPSGSLAGILAVKLFGIPAVMDYRAGAADFVSSPGIAAAPLPTSRMALLERIALRIASKIVLPGAAQRDDVVAGDTTLASKAVLYPERAWSGLTPRVPDKPQFSAKRTFLVACASDNEMGDRADFLMRTIRRIVFGLARTDVQFALIAPETRHKRLTLMARAEDVLPFVTLISAQDRAAVSLVLSSADIAVDPIHRHAHSNRFDSAFVETTIQFTLPLVSFKRDVLSDRLGTQAVFAPAQDVPALAETILDLLDFPDDLAQRKEKLRSLKTGYQMLETHGHAYASALTALRKTRPQPVTPAESHPPAAPAP